MVLLSVNITADDRALVQVLKEMKSEPRVALVIGNKDYTSLNSLKNPLNDARDMADILQKKGFYVIPLENASQYQMEQAIAEFSDKIRSGKGVGLFYYAGHGVEVGGVNYLIPSDARIPSLDFVKSKTVSVDSVISAMENAQNRFNILILDACRSNPFGRGGGGLAPINSATGIYVAYATAPSKIAEDGAGENGLFTSYLKKYINQSGLKIEEVFKNVRREVRKASHKRQTPWTSSSVDGDFYFSLPNKKKKESKKFYSPYPILKYLIKLKQPINKYEISNIVFPFTIKIHGKTYTSESFLIDILDSKRNMDFLKEIVNNFTYYDIFNEKSFKRSLQKAIIRKKITNISSDAIDNYSFLIVGVKGYKGGAISFIRNKEGELKLFFIKDLDDIVRKRARTN